MKLSIIIPVYNEEKDIIKVITDVLKAPVPFKKEIIIIDDGSSDKTRELLASYRQRQNFVIIFQPKNMGKGMAVREGLKKVTGDLVIIQDADREYSVTDYPKILKPLVENRADIVYGSRFLGSITGMRWQNYLANKILTISVRILYGINITDEATAYKAFKTKVLKSIPLKCERFEFCPEVTAKAAKRKFKISEVPIAYHGRNAKGGKKIKFTDGFVAFWTLLKYRFKD